MSWRADLRKLPRLCWTVVGLAILNVRVRCAVWVGFALNTNEYVYAGYLLKCAVWCGRSPPR